MTKRETAMQRRFREAAEAQEAAEKWASEKYIRLLNALAIAEDLGLNAGVCNRYDNVVYYSFGFDDDGYDIISDPVLELEEWKMQNIESRLNEIKEEQAKQRRLHAIREEVLAKLTDEEREALGI